MGDEKDLDSRWRDFRRHPAVQAAAVYIGGAWAIVQVADIFVPNPDVVRWLGIILAVGFLFVVGGAWVTANREAKAEAGESGKADFSTPVWRRRRHLAYLAAGLLVIVGGAFWWLRPNILGAVAPDAQVIAVLPFNTSGPGVEYLGEGVVDLISPNLDEVGAIRTVDSRTVLHRWRQRAVDGSLDFEGALAVGQDVEAGSVLLGSVIAAGPEVRLRAQLYSVRGDELAQAQVEGPADSVLALVDDLAISLIREIWIAREPVPNLRVAGVTTDNVDAIRAYLRGQQFYRTSNWDSALVAFSKAVEEDSTFALAHYRLGLTYGWSVQHGGFGSGAARRHAELAQRYSDRLPARERTLVRAHALFEDGSVAAHDTLQRYVNENPDDPEGWYMLGDVRVHSQPILAFTLDDLLAPFDRVLELDPSMAPAMLHPLELTLSFGDSARYAGYLAAFEAVVQPSVVDRFARARLVWDDAENFDERALHIAADGNLNDEIELNLYHSKTLHPDQALSILEQVAALPDLPERSRLEVWNAKAQVLASLGRLEEARVYYDTIWAIQGPHGDIAWSRMMAVWAGLADSAYAAPLFDAMATVPREGARQRQGALYGEMLLALAQGRSAEARRLADEALAIEISGPNPLPPLFRAGLGWAGIIDGDTLIGIEALRSGIEDAGFGTGFTMVMNQPLRYALATAQASYPATREEGIRRLRYGAWAMDIIYIPLTYLWTAQALEAKGDVAGAVEAYSHFVRHWSGADPDLQPRVETARQAIQRLTRERAN